MSTGFRGRERHVSREFEVFSEYGFRNRAYGKSRSRAPIGHERYEKTHAIDRFDKTRISFG